jgi:membrane protein
MRSFALQSPMRREMDRSSRGHRATSPWQMPLSAWKDIAARTYKRSWDDNVGLVAAGVAFYSFFALVPLLGIIVILYGFAADGATSEPWSASRRSCRTTLRR